MTHKVFKLTKGKECIVDIDDYENIVLGKSWHTSAVKRSKGNMFYYARTNIRVNGKYKTFLLHRLIMGSPKNMYVDHIDGNTLDCRKTNLRICTNQENGLNRVNREDHHSKYPGVTRMEGKWVAQFKQKKIGAYKTEIEAYEAYKEIALENGVREEFLKMSNK